MKIFSVLAFLFITFNTAACSTQVSSRLPLIGYSTDTYSIAAFNEGVGMQTGTGGCTRHGRGICVTYVANEVNIKDLRDPQQMYLVCAYDPDSGAKIAIGPWNDCVRAFTKDTRAFVDNIPVDGHVTIALEQVYSLEEPPTTLARRTCIKNMSNYKNFRSCQ